MNALFIGSRPTANDDIFSYIYSFNGSQLAKMKKSIPDMSLP